MSGGPVGYGAYQAPAQYAGWLARVGAALIDWIVSLLFSVPGVIVALAGPKEIDVCPASINGGIGLCEGPTSGTQAASLILSAIGAVVFIVLYCKKVAATGQSWGHKVASVRLIGEQSGTPISAGRVFLRSLARIISALPFGLGFLWPLWDPKKQTFHDKIMGTVVVKA